MEDKYLNVKPPPAPQTPRLPRLQESATGEGVEFEQKIAGLAALRARKLGVHFQAFSNVAAAKPFDDLILRLAPRSSPDKWTTYFVQLKHVGKKPLALQTFVRDRNFLLKKYFDWFLQLRGWHLASPHQPLDPEQRFLCEGSLDDCRLVIFTTRPGWWGAQQCLEGQDEGIHKMAHNILNTGEGQNCVLRFSEKDKVVQTHLNGDSNEKIYQQEFLPLLRLFCGQSSSDMLDRLITTEIKVVFGKSLPQLNLFSFQYFEFLKEWANNDERNYCLTENTGDFEWIIAEHLRRKARKISQMELLEFKADDTRTIALRNALDSSPALAVQVVEVPAGIRAAKVLQVLEVEYQDSWVYVDSEVLRKYDLKALTAVCLAQHCRVLVLDTDVVGKKLKELVLAVAGAVKVVDFGFCLLNATAGRVPFARLKDEWTFEQLTTTAQEKMLDRPVLFQGEPLALRALEGAWPGARAQADGALLGALARGDAALGAALPGHAEDERLYIPRGLQHPSALCASALRLASAADHLALQGFDPRALRSLQDDLGWSDEEARRRWTVLDGDPEAAFERVCAERSALNVHWVECVGGGAGEERSTWGLAWRRTRGRAHALAALVRPATAACARAPTCVHGAAGAAGDAAAWGARAALLVGPPGAGKSCFLRRAAREARSRDPARWSLFVPVLEHRVLLRGMPDASALTPSHVTQLLAAAAGAASGAARRCLETALWETGAVSVHVDGFDELCPAFKSKMLRLLEMLLQDTKAALVWVSSRPEIETSLHATLRCPSVSLTSITREEQHHYLYTRWAFESQFNLLSAKQSADKVITAMARHAPEDQSTSGLLAAPLHLEMVAEIFAKAQSASLEGDLNLNVCELYQKFVRLKEDDYLKKHGFGDANLENFSCYDDDYFSRLHKNCAMFLLVADKEFKGIDIKPFENFINKKQQALLKAKTGIMWMDEDHGVHFVHYSFVEFFAASWLSENITSEPARVVVRSLYESEGSDNMNTFLNWMLTEGCLLHRALLSRDLAAVQCLLDAGEPVDRADGVGRSALHVAVALRDEQSSARLLRGQCNVDLRDALFALTPLQFADQHYRPSARAGWFMMEPVMRTMERLLAAGAQHCRLQWFAADMRNAIDKIDDGYQEVMKLLMEHGMTEYDYIYALHRAESKFHSKIVHILLTHPLSQCFKEPFAVVRSGMTCLEQSQQLKLSRQLFEEHRKDHKSELCNVPLHCLAYEGNATSLQKELSSPRIDHRHLMFGMTPLHIAVHKRQMECAEFLTDHDHFVNQADTDRFTPLHCAVEIGLLEMVQLLLKKGASVDLRLESGLTPLHLVALLGRMSCLAPLHDHGSDLNVTDDYGFSPLLIATAMGRMPMIEKLLTMGANPNLKTSKETSPLHFIAERNDEPAAKCLLQHRANPHEKNIFGRKPVHIAANHGSLNVIKTLQAFGAEINSLSSDGKTPLHYACFGGQQECVDYLLENGSNVDHRDTRGRSAIHCAAYGGHEQVVRRLLTAGADQTEMRCLVNHTTHFGSTPLTLAAYNGHLSCVECLLQHDAEVNGSNSAGYAALHGAAEKGHLSIVESLLDAGANANSKPDVDTEKTHRKSVGLTSLFDFHSFSRDADEARKRREELENLVEPGESGDDTCNTGGTPLTLAAYNGHAMCVECLLLRGAEVDLRDGRGFTPLHRACQEGHLHVIKALVKAGASVNAPCGNGTPIFLAAKSWKWDCVDFLLTSGAVVGDACLNGLTLLHIAAKYGQMQVVNRILEMRPIEPTDEAQPTVSDGDADLDSTMGTRPSVALETTDEAQPTISGGDADLDTTLGTRPSVALETTDEAQPTVSGGDADLDSTLGTRPSVALKTTDEAQPTVRDADLNSTLETSPSVALETTDEAQPTVRDADLNSTLETRPSVELETTDEAQPTVSGGDADLDSTLGTRPSVALETTDEAQPTVSGGDADLDSTLGTRPSVALETTDEAQPTVSGGDADLDSTLGTRPSVALETTDKAQPTVRDADLNSTLETRPSVELETTDEAKPTVSGGDADLASIPPQSVKELNQPDENGWTPLHHAAEGGYVAIVEKLVAAGADVNAKSNEGGTPLIHAALYGQWSCVSALLEHGAEVNDSDAEGLSPLHRAVKCKHLALVNSLLDAGAAVNATTASGDTPLGLAVANDHLQCMDALLARGADPSHTDPQGFALLHRAVTKGQPNVVKRLLAAEADVNAAANDGRTPLVVAATAGKWACLEVLVRHGARVDACDSVGFTALHAAAAAVDACRAVERLTAAGASVNTVTNTGRTPLMLAVENGCAACVKSLLLCGADVNMADDCRDTALHFAAARGRADALQWMLDAGGAVNAKAEDGNTPLTRAASEKEWECVKVLLTSGGDVNEANNNGNTALHYAAKAGNFKAVEELLAVGASVHAINAEGKTPLTLAMFSGYSKCIDCLLQAEEM